MNKVHRINISQAPLAPKKRQRTRWFIVKPEKALVTESYDIRISTSSKSCVIPNISETAKLHAKFVGVYLPQQSDEASGHEFAAVVIAETHSNEENHADDYVYLLAWLTHGVYVRAWTDLGQTGRFSDCWKLGTHPQLLPNQRPIPRPWMQRCQLLGKWAFSLNSKAYEEGFTFQVAHSATYKH